MVSTEPDGEAQLLLVTRGGLVFSMVDNGLGTDAFAGDGIYNAGIAEGSFPSGENMQIAAFGSNGRFGSREVIFTSGGNVLASRAIKLGKQDNDQGDTITFEKSIGDNVQGRVTDHRKNPVNVTKGGDWEIEKTDSNGDYDIDADVDEGDELEFSVDWVDSNGVVHKFCFKAKVTSF